MPETLLLKRDHSHGPVHHPFIDTTTLLTLELGAGENLREGSILLMAMDLPSRSQTRSHRWPYSDSRTVGLIVLMCLCNLQGCATPKTVTESANREATLGKSKEELLQCAGQPFREATQNDTVTFSYYKEAPMLQESFPASKGSFPRPHHGCWATVLLKEGRVTDIGYRSVPNTIDAMDLCEAIFRTCNSQ